MELPLKLTRGPESFSITDAAGTAVCYIHFDDGCSVRRSVRHRLDEKEAEVIAKRIARALTDKGDSE